MSVETYATMLNKKIVTVSTRPNYVAVEKNYWTELFGHRIAHVYVDEIWYLDRYLDVAQAVMDKVVGSATEHYCQSGYFEHRLPYYIHVDAEWYSEQYPDVGTAIGDHIFTSAQDHFELIGFREGRHPFPGFALRLKPEARS